MSSESNQLKGEIDRNEMRAHWGAWAVVIGLVIEAMLALRFPAGATALENWAPVVADSLVALGVYAEIHFSAKAARAQRELQSITDERLAEAIRRAAEAERETARLKSQFSWRSLSAEQFAKLVSELRKHSRSITIEYLGSDPDSQSFAAQLGAAFVAGRWNVVLRGGTYGGALWFGILVPPAGGEEADVTSEIMKAFENAGMGFNIAPLPQWASGVITSHRVQFPSEGKEARIYVGPKQPMML
jgi:hypothetical protein